MSCKSIESLWPAWSAGDLSTRKRKRFEAHLATCLSCRKRADELNRASRLARESLDVGAGIEPAEWQGLLAGLDDQGSRGLRWMPWTAVAAVALVAVLVLTFWLPGISEPKQLLDGGLLPASDTSATAARVSAHRQIALVDASEVADRYELRLATSDPKVKIVWVFDRNLDI